MLDVDWLWQLSLVAGLENTVGGVKELSLQVEPVQVAPHHYHATAGKLLGNTAGDEFGVGKSVYGKVDTFVIHGDAAGNGLVKLASPRCEVFWGNLVPAAGYVPAETSVAIALHQHRKPGLHAEEVPGLNGGSTLFAIFKRQTEERLGKASVVAREVAHVTFQIATFIATETVMPKDENTLVRAEALLQVGALKDRNAPLELAAVHVVIQGVNVALEFQDGHIQGVAYGYRITQEDALGKARVGTVEFIDRGSLRANGLVGDFGVIHRNVFLLIAAYKSRPQGGKQSESAKAKNIPET